jgi:hypothetical protein
MEDILFFAEPFSSVCHPEFFFFGFVRLDAPSFTNEEIL